MDKTGDRPSQIEKRVHFDRRLGRTKIRPRKQRKAQIDRRAVERVHSVGESDPEVLRRIKFARAADQSGGEVGKGKAAYRGGVQRLHFSTEGVIRRDRD